MLLGWLGWSMRLEIDVTGRRTLIGIADDILDVGAEPTGSTINTLAFVVGQRPSDIRLR